MSRLSQYWAKRNFDATPEPDGDQGRVHHAAPRYSMQRHAASRLHHDLRLEHDGVLLSFAVTRGPSLNPGDKRLAVRTEDHPLDYLDFEGLIPPGNYGAGTVMLWDIGHWQPFHDIEAGLDKGHLHFRLHGARLTGNWSLVRMGEGGGGPENWLMIKEDDAAARSVDPVAAYASSVVTAREMDGITKEKAARRIGPARRRPAPDFIKPQLATAAKHVAEDQDHWAELKLDGYRMLVSLGRDGVRFFTRNGHDWSDRFAPLTPRVQELPASNALLDAEIVAGAGLQGFSALQDAISAGGPFRLVAFDLLHLDGEDLREKPLTRRRARLEKVFNDVPPLGSLRLSPIVESGWDDALSLICAEGGEGLVVKQRNAPYHSGRNTAWRKLKCDRRHTFIIIGWEDSDAKGRPFASLLLAENMRTGLVFRGRVGSGFDDDQMDKLARRMAKIVQAEPAIPDAPDMSAQWVTPVLRAEVRFTEITSQGRLRHPVFLGLRDDLAAPTIHPDTSRERIAGVALSSPDRKVFPGVTKRALAQYYLNAAPHMLPLIANRPLSLLRLPDGIEGEAFYQKQLGAGFPAGLNAGRMEGRDIMFVTAPQGLVAAVQMGAVEFHIGGAKLDRPDRPDRLVFDLDPDTGVSWKTLRTAVATIQDDMTRIGLSSWLLATGGKGIHVVVPLRRVATWDSVKLFSQTYAVAKEASDPARFTASISKSARKGRIFIDWLRNDPAASAVAPYSARARSPATIARPVPAETIAAAGRLPRQTLRTGLNDSFSPIPKRKAQAITAATVARLGKLINNGEL